jgi:hypothetical protein
LLGEEKTKTREDEIMVKPDFFLPKNYHFGAYIKKNPAHSLFGAWSFLLVHIWFTPREEPKGFVT